ncbi:MAG: hypothetical protein HY289_14570 [Planctomycetes bacterium]|nr:hypothetical protein [Planctomycetota bacterium]
MTSSLIAMLFLFSPPTDLGERPAYLFKMHPGPDDKVRYVGQRYHAQPGDLILFDDHNPLTARIYQCCGTGNPLHAGIVFQRKDGSAAVLEAGTNAVMKVFVFDLDERLHDFNGTILIRRLQKPLGEEQATQLRDFALAQEGKPYALGRAILHASPLRPRNPTWTQPFGRTVLDRDRWICSELVVAAATTAGVLDPNEHPANMMLPRDLCYDERYDLSKSYQPPALWYPRAELEYVDGAVRVGVMK